MSRKGHLQILTKSLASLVMNLILTQIRYIDRYMNSTQDNEQVQAQKNARLDEDEGKGQTTATALTTNLVDKMKTKMLRRTTFYTGPFMKVPPSRS